jgi:pyrroline-5-carboxylate reductase
MKLVEAQLAFIGAGNMAEALVRGLLAARVVKAEQVTVTDTRNERLELFAEQHGVHATPDNRGAAASADIVILAVKPQILGRVTQEIADALRPDALVISIAAGVPLSDISANLGEERRLCRAMPNICALVARAATAIAPGPTASDEDVSTVRSIFEAVGMVVEVEENLMDSVTGLSGSGPAYVFMIIEALADAGVKVGLPRYQSQVLAAQTVLGSARLLIDTGTHPGILKDQVTSPGGTAIAGLHTLEEGGLRTTLINAVVEATERSRELGAERKKRP